MLLHCGAETVTREELSHVPTPLGTSTWYPLAHQTILGEVETQLLLFHLCKMGQENIRLRISLAG